MKSFESIVQPGAVRAGGATLATSVYSAGYEGKATFVAEDPAVLCVCV